MQKATQADRVISKFGGMSALARALGHRNPTTVQGWRNAGHIPATHHQAIVDAGQRLGVPLVAEDFLVVELPAAPQERASA